MQLKVNNAVRGVYRDKILKDSVYISSNNFKKDFFLRKDELKLFTDDSSYLSYLNVRSDSVYNHFNQTCNTYYKNFYKKYYFKKYYFQYFIFYKLRRKAIKTKLRSKAWNDYQTWKNISNHKRSNYEYNRFLRVPGGFTNNFVTTEGVLHKFKPKLFAYSAFTGLVNIVPRKAKIYFRRSLSLPFLCLQFKKKLLSFNSSQRLYYTLHLYVIFYKYNNLKFYKQLRRRKIKVRKSNVFLRHYQGILRRKLQYLMTLIDKYPVKELNNFNFNSKDLILWPLEKKIEVFKRLIFNLQLNSNFNSKNQLAEYFWYKNMINNAYLKNINVVLNFHWLFSSYDNWFNSFYSQILKLKKRNGNFITDIIGIKKGNLVRKFKAVSRKQLDSTTIIDLALFKRSKRQRLKTAKKRKFWRRIKKWRKLKNVIKKKKLKYKK